jgi:hypothetical protein
MARKLLVLGDTTHNSNGNRGHTMSATNDRQTRAALAPVILGALVMLLGGITSSQARAIRTDQSGGNGWFLQAAPPSVPFQPADTAGTTLVVYGSDGGFDALDNYGGGAGALLFGGYTSASMYNWTSTTPDSITAQVLVYVGSDDGSQQVCDDAGFCKDVSATITEIDFNYANNNGCVAGGALTWDGVTYKNTSATGSCDNAFVFANDSLFGTPPAGWSIEQSGTVPEPDGRSLLVLGLAMSAVAVLLRRRRWTH